MNEPVWKDMELYLRIFEQSIFYCLIHLLDGKILHANDAFLSKFEYSLEELHNLRISDLFLNNKETKKQIKATYKSLISVKSSSFESEFIKKTGESFYCEVSCSLIEHQGNHYVHSVINDISQKKEKDIELKETKDLLEATLNVIPDVIGIQDEKHTIIRYNAAGYAFLNMTPNQIIGKGKKCYHLINQQKPCAICATSRSYKSKKPEKVERYEKELDKWLDVRAYPILDEKGDIIKVVEHLRDITREKKAEIALKENEENLRTTLDSIGDAVIATDIEGKITRMNPMAEKLTGCKYEDCKGKPLTEVYYTLTPDTKDPDVFPVERFLYSMDQYKKDHIAILRNIDNIEYFIAESSAHILNIDKNIVGVVIVFRDITEKLQVEQERLKLRKLESIGILAGGIAHDFNNLLTGLFGNLEIAKKFLTPEHKSFKFLEFAEESMDRAKNLTNQLLTFARGGDPIKEEFSLAPLITETANFALRGTNVLLKQNFDPGLWTLNADKGQIGQVITNLVINAQQAMPTGGNILISTHNYLSSDGPFVKIDIQDNGIGIPEKYIDKIFDPYFTTKQKGSGLGLSITHSIITKHKGKITVQSNVNEGTTFTLFLPAIKDSKTKKEETELTELNKIPSPCISILVLDDEEIVREVYGAMLRKMGHHVDFALDGQEVVQKYRNAYNENNLYDVVIMDLTIPGGLGGKDAAQQILQINPNAKLVVSSGYANDPVMANYKEHGFKGIVIKPFRYSTIENILKEITENKDDECS